MTKYRSVFLNSIGREVLLDILTMCHFGCTLDFENPAAISEYNVGITILHKCGILAGGTRPDVLRSLSGISPIEEEKEEVL
ncbi:hypothetical protein KKF61_08955 [Patescibacteria group bacterium]|nr:hypothetical protein [Patescibacteria group bacterium]